MDIILFIIGFVIGVVCVALAIEFGMKKISKSEPSSRTTQKWSISEIRNPRVIAEYLGDVDIPKNSRIRLLQKHWKHPSQKQQKNVVSTQVCWDDGVENLRIKELLNLINPNQRHSGRKH